VAQWTDGTLAAAKTSIRLVCLSPEHGPGPGVGTTRKREKKKKVNELSEPGFDPGTCGLWAHHASAAPL
jgi:hypothetical protein